MANNRVKVSVIIPFYNRIEWTIQAIDSVLNQTFHNFEIILVDDGSTEPVKLPARIKKDKRVRYYKLENGGVSKARNFGMSISRGDFIAFLDSDDLFLPDKLQKQLFVMENNSDIYFSHTSYILMDKTGSYVKTFDSGAFNGMVYPRIINDCPIATPTVMMRRELIDEFRFPESIRIGEDNILWIRIARKYNIYGILEPLTKVRKHDHNTAFNTEKLLEGRRNILTISFEEDKSFDASFKRKSYKLSNLHQENFDLRNDLNDEEKIEELLHLMQLIITRRYIKTFVLKAIYPLFNLVYKLYQKIIRK